MPNKRGNPSGQFRYERGKSPFNSPLAGDAVESSVDSPDGTKEVRIVVEIDSDGLICYTAGSEGRTRKVKRSSWAQWCSRVKARLVKRDGQEVSS